MKKFDDLPDDALIPDSEVRKLTGDISPATQWRKRRTDPSYPRAFKIGGRNFGRVGDTREYLRAVTAGKAV